MMRKFILAIILFTTIDLSAQTSYNDSINKFQRDYVDSLYPVIKNDTAYIRFYPINTSLKIVASVTLLKDQPIFNFTTSSGKTKEAQKYALINFAINKKQYQLFLYQLIMLKNNKATENLLFLPFLDETRNKGSYAGGRYIDFEIKDITNNTLLLDFNKAYNPYCAFTTGYNCPIPPRENTLAIAINAGESYDAEKFKH